MEDLLAIVVAILIVFVTIGLLGGSLSLTWDVVNHLLRIVSPPEERPNRE